MKNTIVMLMGIATFLLVWFCVGGIVAWLSDDSFRTILTSPGMFTFMLLLGWIPSIIVGIDVYESYSDYR